MSETTKYRVGKSALMAPANGRLRGASRLLSPNSEIPANVFSKKKIAEHLATGAIVKFEAPVEEPKVDVPPSVPSANKDGFIDAPEIAGSAGGDAKLAELQAKQEAAAKQGRAEGRPTTTEEAIEKAEGGATEGKEAPADTLADEIERADSAKAETEVSTSEDAEEATEEDAEEATEEDAEEATEEDAEEATEENTAPDAPEDPALAGEL